MYRDGSCNITVHSLLFADDKLILAEDQDDPNYMFRQLLEDLKKYKGWK